MIPIPKVTDPANKSVGTDRTTVIEWYGHNGNIINFELDNDGSTAFNLVELEKQDHVTGEWFVMIPNTDWADVDGVVLRGSTGAMTLAGGANGHAEVNIGASYAARLVATVASGTTTANVLSSQDTM